jgi:hypothetical protein
MSVDVGGTNFDRFLNPIPTDVVDKPLARVGIVLAFIVGAYDEARGIDAVVRYLG